MGVHLFDKYTYLHFATGVVLYYWGVSFFNFFILHTIFEITENTQIGVNIIDNYITVWPGGKLAPDSIKNQIGDTIGALLGWLSAALLVKNIK